MTPFDPDLISIQHTTTDFNIRKYSVTYNGHVVGGITRESLGPRGKWRGFLITPDGGYERVTEDRRVTMVRQDVIRGVKRIYDAGNLVDPELNPLATPACN